MWCTGVGGVWKCGGEDHANNYFTCDLCRGRSAVNTHTKKCKCVMCLRPAAVSAALFFPRVGTAFK
jgi:hypothetical protein